MLFNLFKVPFSYENIALQKQNKPTWQKETCLLKAVISFDKD